MILAIDTATRWTGLALASESAVLAEQGWLSVNRRQTQTMEVAPRIQAMLGRFDLTPADLSGIAVTIGPGSYTGLRIGLGIAKGLALPFQTPILTVPTFEVVLGSMTAQPDLVMAVLEAGRKRIIAAPFHRENEAYVAVREPDILEWEACLVQLEAETVFVGEISEGARAKMSEFPFAHPVGPEASVRRPAVLAALGRNLLSAGLIADPSTLTPDYLRAPEGS